MFIFKWLYKIYTAYMCVNIFDVKMIVKYVYLEIPNIMHGFFAGRNFCLYFQKVFFVLTS